MEVLQRTANRGSISDGGYDIDNSLKFERANSEQIFTSNAASGNRKTWTFSAWIKRTQLSQDYHTIFSCGYSNIQIMSNDRPRLILYNGSAEVYADPEMLMRDTSAWYHIVVQVDSTQSTASDRVKWWINGDRITDFNNSTYTNMSQNEEFDFGQAGSGSGNWLRLGEFFGGSEGFSGYMSDVYYLNGTAAQASDFGEYDDDSGIWIPKEYTGSGYGTQGFKYEFKDSSALGTDTSGEGHDGNNLGNITAADQATDTPTNNFAIGNVLTSKEGFLVTTEGATKGVLSTSGPGNNTGGASLISTIPVSKGKWYFEAQNTNSGDVYLYLGVGDTGSINLWGIDGVKLTNQTSSSVGWRGGGSNDGKVYGRSAGTNYTSTNPVTWETEVVGLALDLDNEKIYFHKSGTWINSGDPANGTANGGQYDLVTGVDNQWCIAVSAYNLATWHINFGGYTTMSISSAASDANGYGTFEYAPPSGYYALCTKNLAEYG